MIFIQKKRGENNPISFQLWEICQTFKMKKYHTDELFGCNVRIADEQRGMVHITDCIFPKVPHYCQGLRSAEENNLKALFMCQDRLQTKILPLKQPVFSRQNNKTFFYEFAYKL